MSAPAAFTDDSAGGTLRFTGSLSLANLGDLPERLATYDGKVEHIDLTGIERLDTIGAVAASGVDYVSVGRLMQSAPAADIGLDFELV